MALCDVRDAANIDIRLLGPAVEFFSTDGRALRRYTSLSAASMPSLPIADRKRKRNADIKGEPTRPTGANEGPGSGDWQESVY